VTSAVPVSIPPSTTAHPDTIGPDLCDVNAFAEGTMRLTQIVVIVTTTACVGYGCQRGPDTKGDVRKALDQANMPRVEVRVDTDEHIVHLQGVVGPMPSSAPRDAC